MHIKKAWSKLRLIMLFTMFRLTILISLFAFIYGKTIHSNLGGRIVGGINTTIEDYPYQLSVEILSQNGMHVCGASLLKPNVALTAAHCTNFYEAEDLRIRAGSTIREKGGETAHVLSICQHPKFNEQTIDCDVAILVLDRELPLGKNIQTITLQQEDVEVLDGAIGTVTGWGALHWQGPSPEVLQKIDLSKTNDDFCKQSYPTDITENMFCFIDPEGTGDSCSRDSGGPIVVDGVQVGVVSFGDKCNVAGVPSVYAKLSSKDISSHLKKCLADL
ncbi:hypothetical protein ILUMI_23888 [Ignelater luminosus]|uniref:Peptidase S1 domain-containing protein n=1 Tax=Ignelater luminosus TaxID=2038154 RepID=A0A8K0G1F3_IGNLU|nr:hypothetical protein ILUMI_23888 [Ignelater luminosus]